MFELTADAETRAGVARLAGLRDLPRLEANFEVQRHGNGGLRVTGSVSATVGQTCVVTLEPLSNEVFEEIDVVFAPTSASAQKRAEPALVNPGQEELEPLIGGSIDLGALATEFLVLGVNPYPRKPGAVFEPPRAAAEEESPFAALGALKKDRERH
jgi:uncharacterized metal-binding protein YceD (DUF177 family)